MAGGVGEQFEALLAAYQAKVFRLCYSILGNREQAEHAAQDAFLRIWRGLPKFRGDSSPATWVYAIARNAALTAAERAKPTLSLSEPAVLAAAETSLPPGPDSVLDAEYLVSQLPEKYRATVRLYFMEDRSYEEVAAMLDLPLGTVKTYLYRARRRLALAIEEGHTITKGTVDAVQG